MQRYHVQSKCSQTVADSHLAFIPFNGDPLTCTRTETNNWHESKANKRKKKVHRSYPKKSMGYLCFILFFALLHLEECFGLWVSITEEVRSTSAGVLWDTQDHSGLAIFMYQWSEPSINSIKQSLALAKLGLAYCDPCKQLKVFTVHQGYLVLSYAKHFLDAQR